MGNVAVAAAAEGNITFLAFFGVNCSDRCGKSNKILMKNMGRNTEKLRQNETLHTEVAKKRNRVGISLVGAEDSTLFFISVKC